MAKCYSCNKEISYLAFMAGYFRFFMKNFWRKSLAVFRCPHCNVECQESSATVIPFLILCIALGMGIVMVVKKSGISWDNPAFIIGVILLFFVLQFLWWRFVSRLKKPYQFF